MKKTTIFLISFLTFVGCATKQGTSPQELGEKPDVFCRVIQKPDPLLLGTWESHFVRLVEEGQLDKNYVKYQLVEYNDKYALYFHRRYGNRKKRITEWKNWTINGREVSGEAKFGVRIFVQGSEVYFTIRGLEEPVKMSRVEE